MTDYFYKLENYRHNTTIIIFTLALVFILDLLTPLGFAVRILYLIPILVFPYKTLSKRDLITITFAATGLLWFCYFHKSPGISSLKVVFLNRAFMSLIFWIITYVQIQRANTYKKLSISEENLQLAQSIAHIGSYEIDLITGKVHWSKESFNIFERELSEGNPSYDESIKYIHPDDIKSLLEFAEQETVNEKSFQTEFRIMTRSGRIKNISVSGFTYTDRSGKPIKRIGTFMDITEKKTSDEALRLESSKLRAILDNSPVCISMKDKDSRMIMANPAVYDSFDVPPADKFIDHSIYDFFPKEVADELWNNDLQAIKSDKPIIAEEKIMNRDDKWHYYITAKFPVYYQDSKELIGIGSISTDITEQKRLEESLRISEERFRQTFEKAATGIAYILPDGKWLKVNDTYCKMLGYTREELENFTYKEITHPDDLEHDLQMREKLLSGFVDSFVIEKRYIKKDGSTKWAILTCSLAQEESTGFKYMISILEDITELKFLQEANERNLKALEKEHDYFAALSEELKRSQLRFERAEALAHVGSWIMDVHTGEMEISEEFRNMLGLEPDKKTITLKDYIERFVHPEDHEKLSKVSAENYKEGSQADIEYRIIRTDGTVRYIHGISGSEPRAGVGNFIRFGAATDITEQKLLQKHIEDQRKLMETVIADIPSGILLLRGKDLVIELVNDAYRMIAPGKSMLGLKFKDVWAEVYPSLETLYNRILDTGEVYHAEDAPYWIKRSNNGPLEKAYFTFTLTRIKFPDTKEWGILNTTIETTERVKVTEDLKESERKLREAQRIAHIGSYSIDFKNGGKMEWSDEMYSIWEVDKNAPFPTVQEVWKRVHPDDVEELKRVLYNQLPEGERVETIFRILFPGNRVKYVHIITRVTFDENGNLIRREGIEMDITERKIAQFELEKTLQKLEKSNEELKQFAYIASHDLQEPLRMVSSYMAMLEKKYSNELDDRAKQFIHFAVDGSKRMSILIRDLLAYSRVTTQAKEFTDVDVNKTFSDVTRDLQFLIKEKDAKINSTKLPVIKADPVQMHQLLQNIISNAIKFRSERAPVVNIRAKEIENGWLFSVKDNGIGIDPQFFDRIFQVFQRLHEQGKYPGTGIGLAVCKKIVERHGGRIWIESEIGKGTTFYFTIPENKTSMHPDERDDMEIMNNL